MASNGEENLKAKREARVAAEKAGVKGNDLAKLKAAEKAAESELPKGKSSGWGILG